MKIDCRYSLLNGLVLLSLLLYPAYPTFSAGEPVILIQPFANLSGAEHDWFAVGIADRLHSALARVPDVRVIHERERQVVEEELGRQQHGQVYSPLRVGMATGASAVLTGSYQVSGTTLRVIINLVSVETTETEWSRSVDGPIEAPFALQDRVVRLLLTDCAMFALSEIQIQSALGDTTRNNESGIAPEAYAHLARARKIIDAEEYDRFDNAIRELLQAIERAPDFLEAYGDLVQMLTRWDLNKTSYFDMASAVERGLKDLSEKETISIHERAYAITLHYQLSEYYGVNGDPLRPADEDNLIRARTLLETSGDAESMAYVHTLMSLGNHYYRSEDYAKAGQCYKLVMEKLRIIKNIYYTLITTYDLAQTESKLSNHGRAMELVRTGLRLADAEPFSGTRRQAVAYWLAGRISEESDSLENARGYYAKALEWFKAQRTALPLPWQKQYALLLADTGSLERRLENNADALENLRKSEELFLKLSSDSTEQYWRAGGVPSWILLEIARCYSHPTLEIGWISYYEKAIEADLHDTLPREEYAGIWFDMHEYGTALKYYKDALETARKYGTIQAYQEFNVALCYEYLSEYVLAVEHYGNALSIDSSDAEAQYNRGMIRYCHLNQKENGRNDIQRACENGYAGICEGPINCQE